jgi:hypothetical protein
MGMCSFDARNRGSTRPPPKEIDKKDWKRWEGQGAARPSLLLAEAARSECAPSMRAVMGNLATPLRWGETTYGCG